MLVCFYGLHLVMFVVCWVGDSGCFQVVLHATTSSICKLESQHDIYIEHHMRGAPLPSIKDRIKGGEVPR